MKPEIEIQYYPGDPGTFIQVDEDKCSGCGECAKFCPRDVWQQDGRVYRPVKLRRCVECGACWNICQSDAVIMSEPAGGTGVRFSFG